ncbi:hypothetical protein DEJ03_17175 [Curtobacterium sp. MCLR17_043]|nr:hypothetical protein DEJ03_17175 [Curtobacterium sp. MCLR17_043]
MVAPTAAPTPSAERSRPVAHRPAHAVRRAVTIRRLTRSRATVRDRTTTRQRRVVTTRGPMPG